MGERQLRAEEAEENPVSQPNREAFLEEGDFQQMPSDTGQASLGEW